MGLSCISRIVSGIIFDEVMLKTRLYINRKAETFVSQLQKSLDIRVPAAAVELKVLLLV